MNSLAALYLAHVLRKRTFAGDVAQSITVPALHDPLLVALGSAVAWLLAVAADLGLAVRAVLGEVAHYHPR